MSALSKEHEQKLTIAVFVDDAGLDGGAIDRPPLVYWHTHPNSLRNLKVKKK